MNSIGEQLRSAREKQGRSLGDIAAATRINRKYLEQLEHGITPDLPTTYVRAFLRAYAQQVGINFSEIVGSPEIPPLENAGSLPSLLADLGRKEIDDVPSAPRKAESKSSKRHQLNQLMVLSVMVVVGLMMLLWWVKRDRKARPVQEVSFAQVTKEYARQRLDSSTGSGLSPISSVSQSPRSDSLMLEAVASDNVWMRVVADGIHARECRLTPSEHLRMKSKNYFSLSIDNARAVSFTLNGRKVGELSKTPKPLWNLTLSWDTYRKLQGNEGTTR